MKKFVTFIFIIIIILTAVSIFGSKKYQFATINAEDDMASVFFSQSASASNLKTIYATAEKTGRRINLIIVPGHEPNFGGAQYLNLKEREMTVELADNLTELIKNNGHYSSLVARTDDAWDPQLAAYFKTNWEAIKTFTKTQGEEMKRFIADGKVEKVDNGAYHVAAPTDVALRLYGINKWSNEHDIDLAIHIHFNDYPRKKQSLPGDYSGFTIYIPEKQYSNSEATAPIANAVFKRLSKVFPVSDLPSESSGVVEEQELIAIGSRNTADAPSMLIEFGYLYEPQFQNPIIRHAILKEMALQTYLGLQDFFGGTNDTLYPNNTTLLTHAFKNEITPATKDSLEVLSLQMALIKAGVYPAGKETKNDCPLSGHFGPCTAAALKDFQHTYKITGENGKAGPKTLAQINILFKLLP